MTLQRKQPVGNRHCDGLRLGVDVADEAVGSGNQDLPLGNLNFKQRVFGRVIDGDNFTDDFSTVFIHDSEADDLRPSQFVVGRVGLAALEKHLAVGELARLFLRVDVAEFEQGRFVAAEAVFLDEKRHEKPLDFDDEVVAVGAVEDVVGEHKVHLAFYAVRFADATDSIDVFHCGVWSVKFLIIDSRDFCAERVESGFDVLVAAVDLCDVGDAARAIGRECGDEQGDSCADVRAGHSATAKLNLSVVTDDDGAVRVAEDDLCAHIDEFIDEKQATFKHFLMDEHRSASLRGDNEQHREQVGRQARPRRIGEGHNGAVDERFHGVVRLSWNENVVAFHLDFDAEALKCVGNDAEVFERHVFDGDAVADHCRQADERADFNHIGQNRVFGAAERGHSLDGEQV